MTDVNNSVPEHIIDIVDSNESVPIFSSISMDELNGTDENKGINSEISVTSTNEEKPKTNGSLSDAKMQSTEGDCFMVTPVLQVRQSTVQERIPISAEEIKRRISPPESLSEAHLVNLLRLNKESSKDLQKNLEKVGISEIPTRSSVVSSFSRLSEAEAQTVAEDYHFLASRFMKVKEMNQGLRNENGGEAILSQKAKSTRATLEQIFAEIEKRGSELSTLTHGFSPLILRSVMNIIIETLDYKERDALSDQPDTK